MQMIQFRYLMVMCGLFSLAEANMPSFGCSHANVCSLSDSKGQESLFLHILPSESYTVTLTSVETSTQLRLRFPLRYSAADFAVTKNIQLQPWTNVYDPYLQIAQFQYSDQMVKAPMSFTIHNTRKSGSIQVQVIFGNQYHVTALQIVALPIAMFQTHGMYWTNQGYFWIFLIVAAVLATVYAAFSRVRLWQAVLVYAICAFSTVCCEKIYHAIVASTRVGDAGNTAYAIVVIALCAEGIPAIFCMIMMRQGKCRPIPWAILGLIVAVGFLFLAGSGWFVGVGLLGIASFMRLIGRLF